MGQSCATVRGTAMWLTQRDDTQSSILSSPPGEYFSDATASLWLVLWRILLISLLVHFIVRTQYTSLQADGSSPSRHELLQHGRAGALDKTLSLLDTPAVAQSRRLNWTMY